MAIGAPRLRRLGFDVPTLASPEHRLYERLAASTPDEAHFRYNALLRRLTGFERAAECGCLTAREGLIDFYHFDLYAQALTKIERAHSLDLSDVSEMADRGLVDRAKAVRLFEDIEPLLYRYPAIDPPAFRRKVEEILGTPAR